MRIAHVITSLESSSGGPPIVAGALSSGLAAEGNKVTLVGGMQKKSEDHFPSALLEIPGIEHVNVIEYELSKNKLIRIFDNKVYNILIDAGPFDIIHFHGVWCVELMQVVKVARICAAKLVITPHGMLDKWSLSQNSTIKKVALYLYIKNYLDGASMVHALNEHEKLSLLSLGIKSSIKILGNGVFENCLNEEVLKTDRSKNKDSVYFLFLSRLHYKKGLDYLAKAWVSAHKKLGRAVLIVAGPKDDNSIDDFIAYVDKAGLRDTVNIIGPIYGQEKLRLMREAIAFVLPSRQEGFSMAIIESLSQGTPVVVTEGCNFPEVEEFRAGIVCKLNAREIEEGMLKIASNPNFAEECGRNAISLVSKFYTWETISKKITGYYSELMSE